MKITFLGAAREVTGSCYLLNLGKVNLLVDCGMEQGPNIYENQEIPVAAEEIDAVIVTHAHIDHSGLLPLLVKRGFKGKIYLTEASADLCRIMLLDSAKIQEFEAEWRSRKKKRGAAYDYEPLYDAIDVDRTVRLFSPRAYGQPFVVADGAEAVFIDAGHLLGSASVKLVLRENGVKKTIVFSGDIGNKNKPLLKDPEFFDSADYVVTESTYGDRLNEREVDYAAELAAIIERTFKRRGNVVVPSFAVGRMQEILYNIRKIKEKGLVGTFPDFPVYVDSPLAVEATTVYKNNLTACYDDETRELVEKGVNPIGFDNLHMSVSTDDSKAINADDVPKVILSASGMCEAGRIRHHLKHNLWRSESTIVFVGYQVAGTLGRSILDGAKEVKLFGDKIKVAAEIVKLPGTSSHADRDDLAEWSSKYGAETSRFFVTHGEDEVAAGFAELLRTRQNRKASAPYNGECWDLATGEKIADGNTEKLIKKAKAKAAAADFATLLNSAQRLQTVVNGCENGTNENMRRLAAEINRLCEKYGLNSDC